MALDRESETRAHFSSPNISFEEGQERKKAKQKLSLRVMMMMRCVSLLDASIISRIVCINAWLAH
jgi:hypothetical protein